MKKVCSLLFIAWLLMPISTKTPMVYAGEGHDAGYKWAEEHDIDDPDYSDGNSESFNEGVREYVEDNAVDTTEENEQED